MKPTTEHVRNAASTDPGKEREHLPKRVRNKTALIFWIAGAVGVAAVIAFLYVLEGHVPSPNHVWKLGAIGPVARYLFSFVGVLVTYLLAKSFVHVSPAPQNWLGELKHYLICVGACALLAYTTAAALGTHKEDVDPVFGDGETVVDYEPTQDQRSRHGLIVFLCLVFPAVYGTNEALQEIKAKRQSSATSSSFYPRSGK